MCCSGKSFERKEEHIWVQQVIEGMSIDHTVNSKMEDTRLIIHYYGHVNLLLIILLLTFCFCILAVIYSISNE